MKMKVVLAMLLGAVTSNMTLAMDSSYNYNQTDPYYYFQQSGQNYCYDKRSGHYGVFNQNSNQWEYYDYSVNTNPYSHTINNSTYNNSSNSYTNSNYTYYAPQQGYVSWGQSPSTHTYQVSSVSSEYTTLQFCDTRGTKEQITREEKQAGRDIIQILKESGGKITKDSLYNKIITKYEWDPMTIFNMAKALRHVSSIEGGDSSRRIQENKYAIYDLGLLEVSVKLLEYVKSYCNEKMPGLNTIPYGPQLETSKRHYAETLKKLGFNS